LSQIAHAIDRLGIISERVSNHGKFWRTDPQRKDAWAILSSQNAKVAFLRCASTCNASSIHGWDPSIGVQTRLHHDPSIAQCTVTHVYTWVLSCSEKAFLLASGHSAGIADPVKTHG
jgi:hypothetical protein